MSKFKKTKKISMEEYCPRPVMFNKVVEIQRIVQLEDLINHANQPRVEIPKMNYPTSKAWRPTSRFAFISQFLP